MAKNCQVSTSNSYTGIINQGGDLVMKGNITITVPSETKEYIQEFSLPRLIDSFKGRQQELTDLDSLLFVKSVKKIVISGIPGYGKSELAKQFATQCKTNKRIDDIVWIKAENKDYLENASAKLRNIYEHFKQRKILFIFDNSGSRTAISSYEPPDEDNFYLLITSREKDFYDDVSTFELDILTPNSAIDVFKAILCKSYNEEYKLLYEKLAKHVNCVPLGLQVTAAYVRQQIKRRGKHFDLSNYLDEIKSNQEKFIDDTIPNSIPNDYKRSLAGAVALSIEKIRNEENEKIEVRSVATNALFDCAYLNPDEISIQDLFKIPNINDLLQTDKDLLLDSLSYIDNFCLIRYDPNDTTVSMHRFVQQIVRLYLNKNNNSEIKLVSYTSCIKFSMSMNLVGWKHGIIWKYTDDDEIMFFDKIYLKLIKPIKDTDKFMDIMQNLVEFNCVKTLKIIYERDWDNKEDARLHIIENDFLHKAAEYNSIDVMKMFIKSYDVDINGEGSDPMVWMFNRTPIISAAKSGSIEAIKFLIQNNADIETIDGSEGKTFLFILFELQRLKLEDIKEVLELVKNYDKAKINNWGESLVHIASYRHPDLIEYLVKSYNMDVNRQSRQGHTPLHTLIWFSNYCSHEDAIRTLVMLKKCGARLDLADRNGLTPLQLAQDNTWSQYLIPYLTDTDEQTIPEVIDFPAAADIPGTTDNLETTDILGTTNNLEATDNLEDTDIVEATVLPEITGYVKLTEAKEPLLESTKNQEPKEQTNSSLPKPLLWCILSILSSIIFFYYHDM